MSHIPDGFSDLSSAERKRIIAEKQEELRKKVSPETYKKIMDDIERDQIKIDYSQFGKPIQYTETKRQKRQREKEFRDKPVVLVFFANILSKLFPFVMTIYTLAIVLILIMAWQIYKLVSVGGWQEIFHTTKTLYVVVYFVIYFILNRLQLALYRYAND